MDIHLRGQREFASLSDAEKPTWMFWIFTWVNQTDDAWTARSRGLADMEWVDNYMLGVALVLRSEGGRTLWSRLRTFLETPFAEALDAAIAADQTTFLERML